MKKSILIFALSRSPWIGGIYYRKNITHMLLVNEKIRAKYHVVILTNEKYKSIFEVLGSDVSVVACSNQTGMIKAMFEAFRCCLRYKVKYVFPLMPFKFLKLLGITPVSWIADFQHCHYPEFFEEAEIAERNLNFSKIAKANNPLVLSSFDALNDFQTYFSADRKNVHVVHFSSCIHDELQKLEQEDENAILKKFGLIDERYAITCNQFWQHKNHKVILEMIKKMREKYPEKVLKFVFTGEPNERRNPRYINEIQTMLSDEKIKDWVFVLGFIDRTEQLCLMKHAEFIIQPSLFEGWGTVVEDGKILGKRMILSDIPVHLEQKEKGSLVFESENPDSLLDAILQMEEELATVEQPQKIDLTEQYSVALEDIFV